jgi:cytochrome c-type biogenesis protein
MTSLAIMSFMAGNVAVLSPCVLPAVPFIVSSALEQHKLGPIAISLGLLTSFTFIGASVAMFGSFLGLELNNVREISAWLMILMGFTFISVTMQNGMNSFFNRFANKANTLLTTTNLTGLKGQYILGLIVGAVWSPCIGPTLGSSIALAGQSGSRIQGSVLILIYGFGIIVPFLVLAYGTRHLGKSKTKLMALASNGKVFLGILMISFGISVLSGLDKKLEGLAFDLMPKALLSWLTSF